MLLWLPRRTCEPSALLKWASGKAKALRFVRLLSRLVHTAQAWPNPHAGLLAIAKRIMSVSVSAWNAQPEAPMFMFKRSYQVLLHMTTGGCRLTT